MTRFLCGDAVAELLSAATPTIVTIKRQIVMLSVRVATIDYR
jgi:hypothetical protein